MKESPLEAEAAMLIKANGLPEPEREYQFGQGVGRHWRADFAWPAHCVLLEIDGGMYRGRHVSASGREDDMVRDAYCVIAGWRVLRASPTLLRNGYAIRWLAMLLRRNMTHSCADFPTGSALRPREAARRRVKARAKRLDARRGRSA